MSFSAHPRCRTRPKQLRFAGGFLLFSPEELPMKPGKLFAIASIAFVAGTIAGSRGFSGEPATDAVICGKVLSVTGTASRRSPMPIAVAGQKVVVLGSPNGNIVASVTTQSDGSFLFRLPPGKYFVQAVGKTRAVHVKPGERAEIDLALPKP